MIAARSPRIDLHTHSKASDGKLSPTDLVALAVRHGVEMLALTDHDTVAGLDEAVAAGLEHGTRVICGLELSVTWGGVAYHLLGLNIDARAPALSQGLTKLSVVRGERAQAMGEKLARVGIENAYAGAQRLAGSALVGRAHFARYLVEQGVCRNVDEVFRRYLVPGKPGYVAVGWIGMEEGISWILDAGGIAVLAHPLRHKLTATRIRALMVDFKALGGQALEVMYGNYSPDEIHYSVELARRYALWGSVGSDFHDPQTSRTALGDLALLPEDIVPVWAGW